MKKFDELVEIIKRLRSPDGCPWDREQTLESLKPHLLEETYEVLEAMDEGGNKLMGELGDLLLQVVFQSNICAEKGEFSIEDVVQSISEKMIRRHPHVFGDLSDVKTSEQVLVNWEKIKKEEKEHEDRLSVLDGVPVGLPALLRAEKLQKKASKVGFDWPEIHGVIDKVEEEIAELREEIKVQNKKKAEEELGDLFFALVNLSRHLGVNPEVCLNSASAKFEKRFRYVESRCDLENASLEEMDNLWNESKK
ncbi:nucleoside triphosphate pyrophosphohydrolase [uncultured Cetobacterium sp.]|uniref:nucleoside triphosphate pyrophosphohydrolase n=1 Tax=uncultured Cetobacterium sp. TaxID=527638 RepID=UPI0025F29ACC|nr:nucleoside triphosphate pyrophosphohydrolase [uncultured Cetobacterium sp.]